MAIPDVDDTDELIQRLRQFSASLIDVYQDANVTEPDAGGYVGDDQFMKSVALLMNQNDLRFVTYIVEKKDA